MKKNKSSQGRSSTSHVKANTEVKIGITHALYPRESLQSSYPDLEKMKFKVDIKYLRHEQAGFRKERSCPK